MYCTKLEGCPHSCKLRVEHPVQCDQCSSIHEQITLMSEIYVLRLDK